MVWFSSGHDFRFLGLIPVWGSAPLEIPPPLPLFRPLLTLSLSNKEINKIFKKKEWRKDKRKSEGTSMCRKEAILQRLILIVYKRNLQDFGNICENKRGGEKNKAA